MRWNHPSRRFALHHHGVNRLLPELAGQCRRNADLDHFGQHVETRPCRAAWMTSGRVVSLFASAVRRAQIFGLAHWPGLASAGSNWRLNVPLDVQLASSARWRRGAVQLKAVTWTRFCGYYDHEQSAGDSRLELVTPSGWKRQAFGPRRAGVHRSRFCPSCKRLARQTPVQLAAQVPACESTSPRVLQPECRCRTNLFVNQPTSGERGHNPRPSANGTPRQPEAGLLTCRVRRV